MVHKKCIQCNIILIAVKEVQPDLYFFYVVCIASSKKIFDPCAVLKMSMEIKRNNELLLLNKYCEFSRLNDKNN